MNRPIRKRETTMSVHSMAQSETHVPQEPGSRHRGIAGLVGRFVDFFYRSPNPQVQAYYRKDPVANDETHPRQPRGVSE